MRTIMKNILKNDENKCLQVGIIGKQASNYDDINIVDKCNEIFYSCN